MRDFQGCVAQIQRNESEASALRQPIGDFQGMLDVPATAHPENLRESDTGMGGAGGIESILRIDERAKFLLRGSRRQYGAQKRRAAGRSGPGNFGQSGDRTGLSWASKCFRCSHARQSHRQRKSGLALSLRTITKTQITGFTSEM